MYLFICLFIYSCPTVETFVISKFAVILFHKVR